MTSDGPRESTPATDFPSKPTIVMLFSRSFRRFP